MRTDIINQNSSKYVDELTPETLLEWNYVTCAPPMMANVGLGDAAGAVGTGQVWGVSFPGPRGEVYPSYMTVVGAFTTTGLIPQVQGAIPIVDASATAVGFNIQLDHETTDNHGMELSIAGSSTVANDANKYVVGVHSGYIDATFHTQDWTDFDCVSIGFRKVQAHQSGHGAVLAAASGDPLYTDFATLGIQSADDVQMTTALNDGSGVFTDSGQAPADNHNHRFRVSIDSDGAVTYSHITSQIAGAGTLAAPSTVTAYSFDAGDTIVPYVTTLGNGTAAGTELLLKDIKVVREPSIPGHSRV
tara:strand:- start:305 stop:1213 length:909 start_codon:yes stop_codon:yes gene_type:complete